MNAVTKYKNRLPISKTLSDLFGQEVWESGNAVIAGGNLSLVQTSAAVNAVQK
jgi:hypothetical protein